MLGILFPFPISGVKRPIFRCENVSFRERNAPQRIRETTLFLVSRDRNSRDGKLPALHQEASRRDVLAWLPTTRSRGSDMDVSKNRGKTTKMDGEYNGKPYIKMDDLGVPLFLETPI